MIEANIKSGPLHLVRPQLHGVLQRACACGQHTGKGGQCEECKMKRTSILQRSAMNTAPVSEVPPIVHEVLRSSGQPLDVQTRAFMEPRFRHNFSQVRVHTGAKAAESTRAVNALAYTVGKDIVFGAGKYELRTSEGKRLLAHELTHVVQQKDAFGTTNREIKIKTNKDNFEKEADLMAGSNASHKLVSESTSRYAIQRFEEGPQTFGPTPTPVAVDPVLSMYNRETIERQLFMEAERYRRGNDLRWFFAYAHAMITRQINRNIHLFQRPNALLRLNIHFAEDFLYAVGGQPHAAWEHAFRYCTALGRGASRTSFLVGEAELCGAAMANVHINVDLTAALREVGCIPPTDYGNVLVFVNRGALAALAQLRGQALGAAEAMAQQVIAPFMDMEVKAWRNAAYAGVCGTSVAEVEPRFSEQIRP